jgi:hypothetical protein
VAGWKDLISALLGVSAYQPSKGYGPDLRDPMVEHIRETLGGNLALQPTTRLRWYLADLETAQFQADAGDLMLPSQLCRSMRRDGTIAGLMSTLTKGLIALPKKFYGDESTTEALRRHNGTRSVFDDMFPPSELSLLAGDGFELGVGIAELVPVPGRSFPVMIRLEPEFLRYRWVENRWYYLSVAGMLPITPGDGRWILHTPGGRIAPWLSGAWPALGRSFINKEHALLHRSNYSSKLANPARAALAPIGASEDQRAGMIARLIRWGTNTVFELPPGWDVKIIETKGEGHKVFQEEVDTSDREISIRIAGQTVTTDGGAGFQNSDIHRVIRADIIKDVGEGLAYTLNTQGIPQYVVTHWGADALGRGATVEWDVRRPKEQKDEAQAFQSVAQGIAQLQEVLAKQGQELDLEELLTRYELPIRKLASGVTPEPVVDAEDRDEGGMLQ